MVLLTTSDNEHFTVDRDIAERSVLIKQMIEDIGETDQPIPLPNVSSSVLAKVLEYCSHHRNDLPTTGDDADEMRRRATDISEWDAKFIQVDQEMLFEIILAANYLDIKSLLDVGCKTVYVSTLIQCEHDQRQAAGRDPQAVQYSQRLYAGGGGADSPRKRTSHSSHRNGPRTVKCVYSVVHRTARRSVVQFAWMEVATRDGAGRAHGRAPAFGTYGVGYGALGTSGRMRRPGTRAARPSTVHAIAPHPPRSAAAAAAALAPAAPRGGAFGELRGFAGATRPIYKVPPLEQKRAAVRRNSGVRRSEHTSCGLCPHQVDAVRRTTC